MTNPPPGALEVPADLWRQQTIQAIVEAGLTSDEQQRLLDELGPELPEGSTVWLDGQGNRLDAPIVDVGIESLGLDDQDLIAVVEFGAWAVSLDGASENRVVIGRDENGEYHYAVESTLGGGLNWSAESFDSLETARQIGVEKQLSLDVERADDLELGL